MLYLVWISQLALFSGRADQAVLPSEITVLVDAELPVPFAVSESVQPIQAGTKVKVKSVHGEQVKVSYGVGEGLLSIAKTDFAERASDARKEAHKAAVAAAERSAENERVEAAQRRARRDAARNPFERVDVGFSKEKLVYAYNWSTMAVMDYLKDPSSASFSIFHIDPAAVAEPDGTGRIICHGYVRAENSFGAKVRNPWRTWVQPEGDGWKLVRLMLDGEVLLDVRDVYKPKPLQRAEAFIGMSPEEMLAEFGKPLEVSEGANATDGPFKIYSFDKTKGRETFFSIWQSDGTVSGGMFEGVSFSKYE